MWIKWIRPEDIKPEKKQNTVSIFGLGFILWSCPSSFSASSDTVLIILRTAQSSFNLNAVVDLIPQLPEILCAEIILNHAIPVDADEFDIQYESNTYLFQLKNAGFMAAMLAREMQYFSANLVQFSRTTAKISSAR